MALEALEKFSEVRITQIDESNITGNVTLAAAADTKLTTATAGAGN